MSQFCLKVGSQSQRRSPQRLVSFILLGSLCFGMTSCRNSEPPEPEEVIEVSNENQLIVANAVLEQSDIDGQLLWKLQTDEAIYSQDRKVATVTGIIGNLYEAGEIILSLQADAGQIINDGERVILETGIIVTDNRTGAVIETDLAEWQPENNLLIIEAELAGKYPNGQFTATKAQYFIDRFELELKEEVDALTVEPALRIQSEEIIWQFEEEIVTAKEGLDLQQYTEEKVTTRLQAKEAEVKIADQEVTVSEDILFNSLEPEVQFASEEAAWDIEEGIIVGKESVQITHKDEKVQFRGSEGQFNLNEQKVQLTGAVRGVGTEPPATLQAARVDWDLDTQQVVAQGNIVYEQTDPRLTLTGDRAVGQLNNSKLVISGTATKPVVTKVRP
ncbi:LPS export ABC transporter periplasmic protein LptC [[Leptolyngbya] sp. PCC 7376]|uniref:LPS export ABC transporter periplasmic protein LptC n=1 Tax=[Leptolyngbya] sp. PCC 7376 TaxID=111781 RepID=UPI001CEC5BDD|nr:LPS export ABC transporter periplasmic protein LptC [[Leptolyngbya] sp. PCC 7376]